MDHEQKELSEQESDGNGHSVQHDAVDSEEKSLSDDNLHDDWTATTWSIESPTFSLSPHDPQPPISPSPPWREAPMLAQSESSSVPPSPSSSPPSPSSSPPSPSSSPTPSSDPPSSHPPSSS